MDSNHNPSRREFIKQSAALSGSLVLGFHLPGRALAASGAAAEVNAWVVIQPDDTVVIRVARSEMGQGSFTGLPMLVAEELDCDWSRVRAEYASPAEHLRRNRVWVTMATGGSRSIRDSQEYLRMAGATAREMLVAAAARRWGVPAAQCSVAAGVVSHAPSGRRLRYGELAAEAAQMPAPAQVKLKDPKDWKLIGTSVPRLDTPDKVLGRTVFGTDVQLPGMLHAAIAQCPVFGGRLKGFDAAAVDRMRGVVQVVALDDAVAVVADGWWRASKALAALPVQWDFGPDVAASSETIRSFLAGGLDAPGAAVARSEGDAEAALAGAARVVEARYEVPFLNHATMEPMNCTAWIRGDRVEIWVPTQNAEASLANAAEAAGVPLADVEVHKTHLGGGFGRRGAFQDFVRQAVKIAAALPGRPVKLMWSRQEDMQHDFYRPASATRMKAALGTDGLPAAWRVRVACPSILAKVRPNAVQDGVDGTSVAVLANMPYRVPKLLVDYAMRNTHVPVGFWRAVGESQNPFFRECFLDEMAHAAGQDPCDYRRRLLPPGHKYLGVLEAVAQAAGWGRSTPGVHRGIAVADGYGSYAAAVAEVAVDAAGALAIRRMVVAVDPGYVVNPDSARAQIEGCVAYGLSAALWGEITLREGRVEQSNFHDYRVMRLAEMPAVEALLVPSGGFWGGMGEPPLMPLAPALCNAVFAATGRRVRSLPLSRHDLRWA